MSKPSPLILVGLDPGRDGGCVISTPAGRPLDFFTTPLMKSFKKGSTDTDPFALRQKIQSHGTPQHVFVEQVGPVQGSSRLSAFTFGRFYESLVTLCKLEQWPYSLFLPQNWKKEVLASTDKSKQAAMAWVAARYPGLLPADLADHDGICDAFCILEHGRRQLLGNSATPLVE